MGDIRKFLDNFGVTQPLFELGYVGMAVAVDGFKHQYQYTIDDYENSMDNDNDNDNYYYWHPSEEEVDRARAMIALSKAFEVGCKTLNTRCRSLVQVMQPTYDINKK